MPLNIKDPVTEQLATDVAALAHETKTLAVKTALRERKQRLEADRHRDRRRRRLRQFLEGEAWPQVPAEILGRPLSRDERERILGYGPEGV